MSAGLLALTATAQRLFPIAAPGAPRASARSTRGPVRQRAAPTPARIILAATRKEWTPPPPTATVEAHYAGIRLTDAIGALSHALDMAEGQPVGHSIRTAMIGMRLAGVLQLGVHDRNALFYALLLKDLGSSSNAAQLASFFGADDRALKAARRLIDWTDRRDVARFAFRHARGGWWLARGWHALTRFHDADDAHQRMAETRASRGSVTAAMLAMPQATCDAIAATEEHWDGNGAPHGLRGEQIPLLSRIVGLAQTVEVFEQAFGVQTACEVARARSGRWFDPALVDALDSFAHDATFWERLRDADSLSALRSFEPPERVVYADELRLDTIAEAFARVIDAKSPFTARHSQNVSFLATRTAMELGMTSREVRALRRAGLLHDIGKLGVGNTILDKATALTPAELQAMQRHTRYTLEILRGVPRFARFAMLAASHHERLDGSGYHVGLTGDELTLSMRVLAAADVCEALSAARPYRAGLPVDVVLRHLDESVASGRLCPVAVGALKHWFIGLPDGPVALATTDSTSLIGI
jgi:putative nucleotidyltransferase with HDIG domain